MSTLIAVQLLLLSLTDQVSSTTRSRLGRMREQDRQAGLSTLEIAIIALGLFLIAGIAVLALTTATNNRLNQIQ
jgi:hypothetical protein